MRHGSSNNRRQRNRGGNAPRRNVNQKTQVFDSNGPDVRIRGTAYQVAEKYVALAKDAQGLGDMVLYQSYLQHAEHYQRMINSWEIESQTFEINDPDAMEQSREQKPVEFEKRGVHAQQPAAASADDDLGLPSSILGASPIAMASRENEMENS